MANTYKGYGLTPQGDAVPYSGGSAPASVLEAENAQKLGGVPAGDYALKTDTVANAQMLGGLPPEYYIQPRNLLDNSNFLDPVNQRGQASYTGPVYGIDRWTANANNNIVSVKNGYVSYTNTGTANCLRQIVANAKRFVGKTLTLAFDCQMEESAICRAALAFLNASGTVIGSYNGSDVTNVRGVSVVSATVPEGTEYIYAQMNVRIAGGTVRMYWAALYEGSYTVETLPPYVPKGYAEELLACQVADTGELTANNSENLGGKPPEAYTVKNLLDNSYFERKSEIVNQRGKTTYEYGNTDKYMFDRWSGVPGMKVEDGYVTVWNQNASTIYNLYQNFEVGTFDPNKTYTAAVMLRDGTLHVGSGKPKVGGNQTVIEAGAFSVSFGYNRNSVDDFCIGVNPGSSFDMAWAVLYEGEYTAETLPPYVPKGYRAELDACHERFYRFDDTYNFIGTGFFNSSGKTAYVLIDVPYLNGDKVADIIGQVHLANPIAIDDTCPAVSSVGTDSANIIAAAASKSGKLRIQCSLSTAYASLANMPCAIVLRQGDYLEISRDL